MTRESAETGEEGCDAEPEVAEAAATRPAYGLAHARTPPGVVGEEVVVGVVAVEGEAEAAAPGRV